MAPPAPAAPCRAPVPRQGCGSASARGDSPRWGCGRSCGQRRRTPTSPWPARALWEDEGPRRAWDGLQKCHRENTFSHCPQAPGQAKAQGVEPGRSSTSANSPTVGCGVCDLTARLSFRTLSRGAEQATHHSELLIISCGEALDPVSSSEPCGRTQLACAFPTARFLQPKRAPRALRSGSRTVLPTPSAGAHRDGACEGRRAQAAERTPVCPGRPLRAWNGGNGRAGGSVRPRAQEGTQLSVPKVAPLLAEKAASLKKA